MKQTQHCVVSVFSWVDKNEYRFRQFFGNCNLEGKFIQFCKKRRKNAKTQRKYIEKVIAVLKRTWYDIDKQCV